MSSSGYEWMILALISAAVLVSACSPADDKLAAASFAWDVYGADPAHTKFAPLQQIRRRNVDELQIAWRWTSPDEVLLDAHPELRTWAHESTPLVIDGVLYTATSLSQVAALDAGTGETLWVHDPETWTQGSPPNMGFLHRGVAYWRGVDGGRLFIGTGDAWLVALDPATGEPVGRFGDGGRVDLTEGLGQPVRRDLYGVTSPPTICRDVVVVGSSISDDPIRPDMPPGDVRGFDPRTGKLLWTFQTLPREEPKQPGNANVWTLMSCDEELGIVYLPVSTPTNDYYGGERPGGNLYAESLVALDAATGEKRWHYQVVHHGLWDYDLPAAPILVDLTVDRRPVKAVAQVSKQAFVYVLDRETGEPVWPIEERPVPESPVAGESSSPTQPFPTRPPPFDRQGVSEDDLIDFTPELHDEAIRILDRFDYGPLYHPPSEVPSLVLPGPVGGASWAGAAFDPRSQTLYVPSVTKASLLMLVNGGQRAPGHRHRGFLQLNPPGPRGLPLWKPPYGRVTAIDLKVGEISWTSAIGSGPRDHPALADLDLPPLGWPRRSFVLLTDDVLFVAQQGKWRLGGMNEQGNAVLIENENDEPSLRALDPRNGRQLAEISLPGNATGSPMTYLHEDRQYIVLAIGGGQLPAELIALALPRDG